MGTIERIEGQNTERAWLANYAAMHRSRDEHIRRARQLGLSVAEISRLVNLDPSRVSKITSQG